MAVNDPNYRYATQTWEADGVRLQYEIAFDGGYIRQSDVVAFSVLVDPVTGIVSDRQIHGLAFLNEEDDGSATVQIEPAVPAGRRVVIFRSTEKSEPLVNYSEGSVLTEANLDLANRQAILAIAEIMDGLNAAQIHIDQQVQEIIDTRVLIETVHQYVLELLNSSGIISVDPVVHAGLGNGEDTDFELTGAAVNNAAFYDTYVDGVGLEPGVDYEIVVGAQVTDPLSLRFTVAPADGVKWFAVERGHAKPYTGPAPITTLRIPVIDVPGAVYFADITSEFALLRCTSETPPTVTIKPIPAVGGTFSKMGTGSYFSVVQRGSGQVTIVGDTGVTVEPPPGCLPRTRGRGAVVSATCEYADGNVWLLSGDLAKE